MESKWMVLYKIEIYLELKCKIGEVVICGSLFFGVIIIMLNDLLI